QDLELADKLEPGLEHVDVVVVVFDVQHLHRDATFARRQMIDPSPPKHRSILRTMHARSAIMVNASLTRPAPRRASARKFCWSGCHFLSIFGDHLPCPACARSRAGCDAEAVC